MNMVDNGITEVIKVDKVITDDEMFFKVTFKDWYNQEKTKKFMDIKKLTEKTWVE